MHCIVACQYIACRSTQTIPNKPLELSITHGQHNKNNDWKLKRSRKLKSTTHLFIPDDPKLGQMRRRQRCMDIRPVVVELVFGEFGRFVGEDGHAYEFLFLLLLPPLRVRV